MIKRLSNPNYWQTILKNNTTSNFREKKFDICSLLRAQVFVNAGQTPEPIIRARAFQHVLENITLICDGGRLFGNCSGLKCDTLPNDLTEFDYDALMEVHRIRGQRDFWAGFDHTLADYPTLLRIGILGYQQQVQLALIKQKDPDKQSTLQAFEITLNAFSSFISRCANVARDAGLDEVADNCAAISTNPPTTFSQAIQLIWLTHLAFKTEGRCHMALGRIDQYLLPFYLHDLSLGQISESEALEWLCHLWSRLDEIGEVQNICIGGLTPEGDDGTNELSYLCLEATRRVASPYTNLSARFHDKSPEAFHRACFRVIRTGIGFPAIFNDHVLITGLMEIGIPAPVARDACMVGCIETKLAGKQPPWSDSRFNTPIYLLNAIHQLKRETDCSYKRLIHLFRQELVLGIEKHVKMINEHIARYPAKQYPDPFLSAVTQHCIERGLDINNGGAAYPRFHGIAIMGLATIADSLSAIKKLVFEEPLISYPKLIDALDANFVGYDALRAMLLNKAPKYGNDDRYVDEIAAQIVSWTANACLEHQLFDGGRFVSAMAANTQNISAGREVPATPDGRFAYTPLSDAASPYFGRDVKGPTAFLNSVSVPDYHLVLTGSVINMRFDPDHFQDDASEDRFLAFTRAFVANRVPELQFNFTSNTTLLAAQQTPELYKDLVVRVSGFSARFVELAPEVQADIMRRRAHVVMDI